MKGEPRRQTKDVTSTSSITAYAVTFLILYLRFMLIPLSPYSIFLQVFIIYILLILFSNPSYFTKKFVLSRIVVLLIIAYSSEEWANQGPAKILKK